MGSIPKRSKLGGDLPSPPRLTNSQLTLSFKYFRQREPFTLANGGENYPNTLLARLQAVCWMTADEFRASGSKALRCHPIDWDATTEKAGFDHINAQLAAQIVPFQFSVSANSDGRVHGFWIEDTFFVVWLDPKHQLYRRK